jgi:hypothetical protein
MSSFSHYTLDQPAFRAINVEATFVVLGIALLVYDWRFGTVHVPIQTSKRPDITDESPESEQ